MKRSRCLETKTYHKAAGGVTNTGLSYLVQLDLVHHAESLLSIMYLSDGFETYFYEENGSFFVVHALSYPLPSPTSDVSLAAMRQ